ncbi:hypothetical protein NE865_13139 [Phthorimaea operculella]|nr:hypothetical protein NE865_13139 [Phthorimaea operculella]
MDTSALLANNKADLDQLFSRMGEFEIRLKNATASPAPVHTDVKILASEYADFKNLVWQALTKISAQTNLLSLGLERHEAFMRRKVLLFHGVTESKEEKLAEVIAKVISDKMQLSDITSSDLQACHRLGSSSTKTRPVLVRFRDLDKRREVWDSKTALKNTGMVISEFLTKSRHDLFVAARKYYGLEALMRSHPVPSTGAAAAPVIPSPSGQGSAAKVVPPARKQAPPVAPVVKTNASHGQRAKK